jgi:Bacterial Ig domain
VVVSAVVCFLASLLLSCAQASAAVTVQNFSYTVAPGATLIVNAPGLLSGATDSDGGTLTASTGVGFANHGSPEINSNGSFTFTADQGFIGVDSFTFEACDSMTFNCVTGTVSLTITAAVPTAVSQSYTIAPGATLSLPALTLMKGSTVPSGDSLTAQQVGYDEQGLVTIQQDGGFDYSPPFDFVGNDSFSFELCGSLTGLCSTAAVVNVTVGTAASASIPRTIRLVAGKPIKRLFALVGAPTPTWSYTGKLPKGLRLIKSGSAHIELVGDPPRSGKQVIHLKLSSTIFPAATDGITIDVVGRSVTRVRLQAVSWPNATLPGAACESNRTIPLKNHVAQLAHTGFGAVNSAGPDRDLVLVSAAYRVTYGQLAGLGPAAAVDVTCSNNGGTADGQIRFADVIFGDLLSGVQAVGLITPQQPRSSKASHVPLLGKVRWSAGRLQVDEYWYGPRDPTCCATGRATTTWAYRGGRLAVVNTVITKRPTG